MAEVPGSSGSLTPGELALAPRKESIPRSPVLPSLSSISVQKKTVRTGTFEPAALTLLRRCLFPFVVVLMLANCLLIAGQPLAPQFWGLALIAFLVSMLILRPPPLLRREAAVERDGRSTFRLLLEWVGVACVLLLVSAAFNITQTFPRTVVLEWLLASPYCRAAGLSSRLVASLVDFDRCLLS